MHSPLRRGLHGSTCSLSKVGKQLLRVPEAVSVSTNRFSIANPPPLNFKSSKSAIVINGPMGQLSMPLASCVSLVLPGTVLPGTGGSAAPGDLNGARTALKKASPFLQVKVRDALDRRQKALWGTTRRLIENMVVGVTEGFTIPVKLVGVGYRAALEGSTVTLKLGHSHPIVVAVPEGVEVNVPAPQRLILRGIDLQVVSQFAANIRKHRPPEPYNQKGVFVGDETIRKKEGKKR